MKEVLLIDCGNYNAVTTVQINYIKCLLKEGFKITYVIFKDGNKVEDIKFQRWPAHDNLIFKEVNSEQLEYKFLRRIFGKIITNYFLIKRFLKRFDHAICFEYYSSAPVFIHSLLNKKFSFQIATLELYNTKNLLIDKSFQNAKLITTQDELRKEQIEHYYKLSKPSNVNILYNTSLSFEEITPKKIEVPERIKNKKKILFIGSLIPEHCIEVVIDWIKLLPEEYCLVFHGWGLSNENRDRIEFLQNEYPQKVWLSKLTLSEADKWKMYNIADYGVVMFNDKHRNNEFAGLSAGKLFDFIRIGVPVIVSETKLLKDFTEKNSVGISVSDLSCDNLTEKCAQLKITQNRVEIFKNFSFDSDFEAVIEQI